MEHEIWKVYKETYAPRWGRHVYEVSNLGNVKDNGILIDLSKHKKGCYYAIGSFFVHRAVAELFIPNHENKPCVDHINTNSLDNRAENLRWCTQKENCNNPLTKKHNSEAHNKPDVIQKSRKTMINLWNEPEFRKNRTELLIEANKRPEVRKHKSESKKGTHNSETHNKNISKAKKEFYSDPVERKKQSQRLKGKHKDKCWMSNGVDQVFIKKEEIEYYSNRGYHFGRN